MSAASKARVASIRPATRDSINTVLDDWAALVTELERAGTGSVLARTSHSIARRAHRRAVHALLSDYKRRSPNPSQAYGELPDAA